MQKKLVMMIAALLVAFSACSATLDPYTVTWEAPGGGSSESMPLGNGAYGINLWVEPNGDICFYVSGGAAWSGNGRLLKLGRVRLHLEPGAGTPVRQSLDTATGVATVVFAEVGRETTVDVWVDAHYPVVRACVQSAAPVRVRAALESWRRERRELRKEELHSAYGLMGSGAPVWVEPDRYADGGPGAIVLYHRNETSIYENTLKHQDMASWIGEGKDPLLHRTFGIRLSGSGFTCEGKDVLVSEEGKRHLLSAHLHCTQTDTAEAWIGALEGVAQQDTKPYEESLAAHRRWWQEWRNRSWIHIENDEAGQVNQGYALQRYITACAGRGEFPIKFNGTLFTVDGEDHGARLDADYRRWGGPYWFQNTRLVYWPMLAAGDMEMMIPLFRMYRDMFPFAKARTRAYFNHDGAFFPETLYFWGAYANDNYGYAREGLSPGITENRYIRYYYDGALELVLLMLAYYHYTGDETFVREYMTPFADAVIRFYVEHYPKDEQGKLRIYPSQALETYQDCVNPMPVAAGLRSVLEGLCALPETVVDPALRGRWKTWLDAAPDLPIIKQGNRILLGAASEILEAPKNSENPELYAVFPYRRFGVGKPDLKLAVRTFKMRRVKGNVGWNQDDTQAALLGLADEAKRMLLDRVSRKHEGSRFPAFWGPNFDWIPDQDHGGNAMMALQQMLMQSDGMQVRLFPAWPREWNVSFKLHGPGGMIVEGCYRNGKLENLSVSPEEYRSRITVMLP